MRFVKISYNVGIASKISTFRANFCKCNQRWQFIYVYIVNIAWIPIILVEEVVS